MFEVDKCYEMVFVFRTKRKKINLVRLKFKYCQAGSHDYPWSYRKFALVWTGWWSESNFSVSSGPIA